MKSHVTRISLSMEEKANEIYEVYVVVSRGAGTTWENTT
jgi:hypothetical protein